MNSSKQEYKEATPEKQKRKEVKAVTTQTAQKKEKQ